MNDKIINWNAFEKSAHRAGIKHDDGVVLVRWQPKRDGIRVGSTTRISFYGEAFKAKYVNFGLMGNRIFVRFSETSSDNSFKLCESSGKNNVIHECFGHKMIAQIIFKLTGIIVSDDKDLIINCKCEKVGVDTYEFIVEKF